MPIYTTPIKQLQRERRARRWKEIKAMILQHFAGKTLPNSAVSGLLALTGTLPALGSIYA